MTLAELETLARLDLAVLVVVFNDSALSLIEIKQAPEGHGGEGAVRYRDTDFAAVAGSVGIPSAASRTRLPSGMRSTTRSAVPARTSSMRSSTRRATGRCSRRYAAGLGMTVSARIAAWVDELAFDDIPAETLGAAKLHLLDTLGAGLAAHALGVATAGRDDRGVHRRTGPSTVLGSATGASPAAAALANGMLCHGLDFDDTHADSICHVGVVVAPAALAVAEAANATGRELLRRARRRQRDRHAASALPQRRATWCAGSIRRRCAACSARPSRRRVCAG